MKVSEKVKEMEERYGMSLDEIALEVPYGDLETDEVSIIQAVINMNHVKAIDLAHERLTTIEDVIFEDPDDEAGPREISMFG